MDPIRFDRTCYWAGEQPFYLLSGEFHYFRVPKKDWKDRLRLFKETGGNAVATYVPWLLHEPREGSFTFGETSDHLDLEGFLQAALEAGLYVIARPGPYQYSELHYDGLPGWLCENYPGLLARSYQGHIFRRSSVSYLHPVFLEKVKRWFEVVCPILARYTVSRGGPIALVQLDNELTGIHEWFGSLDYNPETMGFGRWDGRFPTFLARRYQELDRLNQAYGEEYPAFEAVDAPDPSGPGTVEAIRRRKDYFDFYLSTTAEYFTILANAVRLHGIDTPLIHNSGNPGMNAYFLEAVAGVSGPFLIGSDHYYNLNQDWAQNNPTPQYGVKVFWSNEMLRLMGFPPTVLELPGGSCSDWPPALPEDLKLAYRLNLMLGMKGSNFYIFTGGPNPPGAGNTTDLYDYGAAIGSNGEIRPLYAVQKDFGRMLTENPWLVTAWRAVDVRFGLDFELARAHKYWQGAGEKLLTGPEAWSFFTRGPLTTALCANLSPELVVLENEAWTDDLATPVVVATGRAMSLDAQQNIVRFLKKGGRILILPGLPDWDESLAPCTLLAEFLGSTVGRKNPATVSRNTILDVANIQGISYIFDLLPDGAHGIGTDEFSGQIIAWQKETAGGGRVVVAGVTWSHAMHEHTRLINSLLAALGLERQVACSNPYVWTTLVRTKERSVLYAANLFTQPATAEFHTRDIHSGEMVSAGSYTLPAFSVVMIDPVSGKEWED